MECIIDNLDNKSTVCNFFFVRLQHSEEWGRSKLYLSLNVCNLCWRKYAFVDFWVLLCM